MDFEKGRLPDGSLTLRPGQPLRFRYRVVIHPGDAYSGIRAMYEAYKAMK